MYPLNKKVIKQQVKLAQWFLFSLFAFVFLFVNAYIAFPGADQTASTLLAVGNDEVNISVTGGQFGCGMTDAEFSDFVQTYCGDGYWQDAGYSSFNACTTEVSSSKSTNCSGFPENGDTGPVSCQEAIEGCTSATGGIESDLNQCVYDKNPSCVALGGTTDPTTGDDQPDGPTTGDDQPDGPTTGGKKGNRSVSVIKLTNPLRAETVEDLILAVVKTLLKLAIPVAILFIIWSGFKFVMAQGNPEKIKGAIKTFQWTVIGLAVIFGAYVIATIIKTTIESLS